MDEVLGTDSQDVVTIADCARFVDGNQPIGIAIKAEANIGTSASHEVLGLLREERPTLLIDIRAIGLSCMDNHSCAKLFKELWRHCSGGPIGAVKHHP